MPASSSPRSSCWRGMPSGCRSTGVSLPPTRPPSGAPYRKVHLVPFGEYVPLPRLFFFVRQISTEIGAFSPADAPEIVREGPLAIGMGICYEILYPSLARRETANA